MTTDEANRNDFAGARLLGRRPPSTCATSQRVAYEERRRLSLRAPSPRVSPISAMKKNEEAPQSVDEGEAHDLLLDASFPGLLQLRRQRFQLFNFSCAGCCFLV